MPKEQFALAGGREIVLPFSKAVEISLRSLKIRFGRSIITTSGVILAIAFLMSVWSNNEIIDSLRTALIWIFSISVGWEHVCTFWFA